MAKENNRADGTRTGEDRYGQRNDSNGLAIGGFG